MTIPVWQGQTNSYTPTADGMTAARLEADTEDVEFVSFTDPVVDPAVVTLTLKRTPDADLTSVTPEMLYLTKAQPGVGPVLEVLIFAIGCLLADGVCHEGFLYQSSGDGIRRALVIADIQIQRLLHR